jgi:hypothetical protein
LLANVAPYKYPSLFYGLPVVNLKNALDPRLGGIVCWKFPEIDVGLPLNRCQVIGAVRLVEYWACKAAALVGHASANPDAFTRVKTGSETQVP